MISDAHSATKYLQSSVPDLTTDDVDAVAGLMAQFQLTVAIVTARPEMLADAASVCGNEKRSRSEHPAAHLFANQSAVANALPNAALIPTLDKQRAGTSIGWKQSNDEPPAWLCTGAAALALEFDGVSVNAFEKTICTPATCQSPAQATWDRSTHHGTAIHNCPRDRMRL